MKDNGIEEDRPRSGLPGRLIATHATLCTRSSAPFLSWLACNSALLATKLSVGGSGAAIAVEVLAVRPVPGTLAEAQVDMGVVVIDWHAHATGIERR